MTINGTLMPAYGNDYKSIKEVQEALDSNKDFILRTFNRPDTYINRPQLVDAGVKQINIRYKQLRECRPFKVKPNPRSLDKVGAKV